MYQYSSLDWYESNIHFHCIDYYKDLLVLTSDSGCLTILEFDLSSGLFKAIVNHQFGKVGCIKEIPGQYLQISPDNRFIAICIFFIVVVT